MASAVDVVGAKGSADTSASLTTAGATPTGSDRAILVFTLGESTGYATDTRLNSSGGALINDFTSADIHLNVATNFRQAYGKVFGEVATPSAVSTAIYALFGSAGNSIVVVSVFLKDVDQSTPFGTEQVSAESQIFDPGTVSQLVTGGTEGDICVGCLFVQDFAGSASSVVATNADTTIVDSLINTGPENDLISLYVVTGVFDEAGECTLSCDVTPAAAFTMARMWGIPVNGSASGPGPIDATASLTEANDTLAASVAAAISASAATLDAADTVASAVGAAIALSGALTEAPDTAASTAVVVIVAVGTVTEASNTVSSTVTSRVSASGALTEANDIAAATATSAISATAALVEQADTVAANTVGPGGIIATANIVEQPDTISSTAATGISLSAAVSEANDTVASSALLSSLLSAALTEAPDTASSIVALHIVCSAAMTEQADTLAATIRALGPGMPVPTVIRGYANNGVIFDLGLLAIRADGTVTIIL